jgi:predicted O-methyltransferase YrrM
MHDLDDRLKTVMARYEARRDQERAGGRREIVDDEGRDQRMRAIGPDAGTLLNVIGRSLRTPRILEIGTSFGYSGLWLADAARATGGHVISIEYDTHKSEYAQQETKAAGLSDWIDHRVGDAVTMVDTLEGPFDLVFLDLWKHLYLPCFEAFLPKLTPGAIIVADNMGQSGNDGIDAYAARVRSTPGIASVLLPVGSGMEVSRLSPEI